MGMIPVKDTELIRKHFEQNLSNPVTIDYYTQHETALELPIQECMYCRETHSLLEEVAALHPQIKLNIRDFVKEEAKARAQGIDRIPAFVVSGASKGQVRFFGIPSGYEFSTLIEDLVDVSRGTTDLPETTKLGLADLTKEVHIRVFLTPT